MKNLSIQLFGPGLLLTGVFLRKNLLMIELSEREYKMTLEQIYNEAMKKLETGDFKILIIDKDFCTLNNTNQFSNEEEIMHWLLAKMMANKNDRRYRNVLKYVKAPQNINFNINDFTQQEILNFISPQTISTCALPPS
jgi:hypothetical protein